MTTAAWHPRYGNLDAIAARTRSRCHLCHDPVDLAFYGRTGEYGPLTVNVDHLWPQALGGDDDPENLRVAHGNCNSVRGTMPAELVREHLAGTADEPLSQARFDARSIVGAVGVAGAAGHLFAGRDEAGRPAFNHRAALLAGAAALIFTRFL